MTARPQGPFSVASRIRSFGYALRGLGFMLKTQHNAWIHLAATAIAVILLYEAEAAKGPIRPLHLVSFSADLSPLRLALHHKRHFPYLRHGAADTLIRRDVWESRYCPGLKWTLIHGNHADMKANAPEAEVVIQSTRGLPAGEGSS